jgi:hypothetical protein
MGTNKNAVSISVNTVTAIMVSKWVGLLLLSSVNFSEHSGYPPLTSKGGKVVQMAWLRVRPHEQPAAKYADIYLRSFSFAGSQP